MAVITFNTTDYPPVNGDNTQGIKDALADASGQTLYFPKGT